MNFTKKILSLLALLLLTSAITSIYAQNTPTVIPIEVEGVQQLSSMTIFNSENFYADDNIIAIQNGFVQVLSCRGTNQIQLNSEILSVYSSTPPPLSCVADNSLNKLKTTRKQLKIVVAKNQKPEEKNNIPQFIAWGNSPYSNSLYIGVNNFVAVAPNQLRNITRAKANGQTNYDPIDSELAKQLQFFSSNTYDLRLTTYDYNKQAFQSHEIAFTSSNYSKTSRIRPPPSPPTPEGAVANC